MAETDPFVHLHVHNEYSMLDGAAQIAPMMEHVSQNLKQPAIATTNHGFMFDSYEFTKAAENAGVKPIIGVEAYIAPESRLTREARPYQGVAGTEDKYSHMTILAENNTGLHNLFRLSSLASLEGFYYKPRMDREILSQHSEGLIATTGCLGGEVNQLLLRGEKQKALEAASEFRDIFGKDNFFYEIMDHAIPEERAIFKDQLEIAKRLGLPLVATNDSHYLHADQKDAHQALLCVQTGSTLDNPSMTFNDGFHVKSSQEMRTLWRDFQSACDNTLLIAERCNTTLDARDDLYPDYPVPDGHTFASYLREVTWEGVKERYGTITEEIKSRVEYELGIIEAKNYPGYFLVVSDFVKWGKNQGIMFGPARGSGGGSIIAYALHITDLDPLRHGLLFERFLNPERPSAPDFDIDIQDDRRGEVIEYVTRKYGSEYVAQIVTYGNIKGKSAIKDAARVLGQPLSKADTMSKLYPPDIMGKGASLAAVFDEGVDPNRYREGERLRALVDSDPDSKRIAEVARGLEGMKRQWGVHAAAIVVSSHKLLDLIPIMKRPSDGAIITQFDYPTCESLGLLKMDFLGLTNLSTLSKAREHVRNRTGEDIEYTDLPLDDKKTYEMLARGETMGVFQLDSDDMRKLMRKMRPNEFDDIIAVGALYRPGPMGVNSHNKYADRKNGREQVDYIHPELTEILKPVLGPTYGLCVYQEQVMEIGQVLADYSLGEADNLRRIMGKKKKSEIDAVRPQFEAKMREKGFSKSAFEAVWDVIVPFSDYAFNKSHAAAYGLVSYWTAYMKAHYPVEYMAALLSDSMDKPASMSVYLGECRRMGIEILPPDVNVSNGSYTPNGNRSIVFGLSGIKGVSDASSAKIINVRPEGGYVDLTDFFYTTGSNSAVGKALATAGAFDCFGYSRAGILEVLPEVTKLSAARRKSALNGEWDLLSTIDMQEDGRVRAKMDPPVPDFEWSKDERLEREYATTQIYLSGHPLDGRTRALEIESTCDWEDILTLSDGEHIVIGGLLTDVASRVSKRGNPWAEMNLRGLDAVVAMRCFDGKLLKAKKEAFKSGNVVMVMATVVAEDESYFLKVDNIKVVNVPDEEVAEIEPVEVRIKPEHLTKDLARQVERLAKNSRGTLPMTLIVAGTEKRMKMPYKVRADERLKRGLIEHFGPAALVKGF